MALVNRCYTAAMEAEPPKADPPRRTGQIAIQGFLRLCLFVFVAACWGLVLGFTIAVVDHASRRDDSFDAAVERFSQRYAAGATFLGVVAGAVDFMICATWSKTTGLLIHTLLWMLIPANILGLMVFSVSMMSGTDHLHDQQFLIALAFTCVIGCTFGFLMGVTNRMSRRLSGTNARH